MSILHHVYIVLKYSRGHCLKTSHWLAWLQAPIGPVHVTSIPRWKISSEGGWDQFSTLHGSVYPVVKEALLCEASELGLLIALPFQPTSTSAWVGNHTRNLHPKGWPIVCHQEVNQHFKKETFTLSDHQSTALIRIIDHADRSEDPVTHCLKNFTSTQRSKLVRMKHLELLTLFS